MGTILALQRHARPEVEHLLPHGGRFLASGPCKVMGVLQQTPGYVQVASTDELRHLFADLPGPRGFETSNLLHGEVVRVQQHAHNRRLPVLAGGAAPGAADRPLVLQSS